MSPTREQVLSGHRTEGSGAPVVEAKGVWKIFGAQEHEAFAAIQESNLSKAEVLERFGAVVGVRDVNISVGEGEIFCIMGLSGSGKSTLVRHINRLIEPTHGQILINGTDVGALDAEALRVMRADKIGMVFQNMALLPHRTVRDNVAFALELRNVDPFTRANLANETIELVGLVGYGDRMPSELSGGMQQRVGLARAMAADPDILLMDEPFSALDPLIRRGLQDEFLELSKTMKKTTLFITHDLDEAIRMGSRIAIMKDGAMVQTGTPEEIVTEPADDYVADFVAGISKLKLVFAHTVMQPVDKFRNASGSSLNVEDCPKAGPEDDLDTLVGLAVDQDRPIVIMEDSSPVGVVTKDDLLRGIQGGGLKTMSDSADALRPFEEFAGANGAYYSDVFLKIQKSCLPRFHVNLAAMVGSFVWATLRGSWLLFTIGFVIDVIAAVNAALVFKYSRAAVENADKAYLVDRYEGWADAHLVTALIVIVFGRLGFGWLADRLYSRQYERWRINHTVSSGLVSSRLLIAALITALIVPLLLYRTTQFAPDARTCIKQDRAIASGEEVSFKKRFDCFVIGEFPTLLWIDRPDEITFPRDDNGNRIVKRTAPSADAPPVNLNTYTSQAIDDSISYLTVFYGFLFDSVTNVLRGMLSAITSVFVGTPWPITMAALLFIAHRMAGPRVTIFVGASLVYLALFGFWQTAMDTMSLVVAASIICVVVGLPLGIWVGKSKRGQAIITPILDVMQTIPSFVYLLPAIAFFSIGKPPGILATVIFAMPPMVRLTALGIKHVPENTKEAALAFGANPRQLLTKVEMPLALPSIMTGINQVVMMSLSMVVVAALIGAGGMGYVVTEALENTETGRGVLAGIGIALLAMMIDRVVQKANKARQ